MHQYQHNYSDSNLSEIQQCLERGLDPNFQLYSGITLFQEAVCFPSDNFAVVHELIKAGANMNASNHLGLTPLFHAMIFRKKGVFIELIESGASVNAKDFLGRTILHHAVCRWVVGNPPRVFQLYPDTWIVQKLLKHENIDCNQVDWNGETPLMLAIKDKQITTPEMLLANAANPNICNNDSETPLHVAFSQPPNPTELLLLLYGASIYSLDKNGQTPLDILIGKGLANRTDEWIKLILHAIASKYSVTSDIKKKFELFPELSWYFNKCCDQVDQMMGDFICGKITMHDFLWDCFHENDFEFLLQIHKRVVERLIGGSYSEYFYEILCKIPENNLLSILQMTVSLKKRKTAKVKILADLFSMSDIVHLFSKYLSNDEIFNLIEAFSGCENC